MCCTQYEASWNVNNSEGVPNNRYARECGGWAGAFDLHSTKTSRHTALPTLGWIFLPEPAGDVELTSQGIVSREERLIARWSWGWGLEKRIKFLTPCSSSHSFPSSKISSDCLLRKGLESKPTWNFWCALICPSCWVSFSISTCVTSSGQRRAANTS